MSDLNGFSIFGGIVFIVVIALVIYPISFRIPLPISEQLRKAGRALRLLEQKHRSASYELKNLQSSSSITNGDLPSPPSQDIEKPRPIRVRIGLFSAPLLGVLLLLITTSIGGEQIAKGIAGAQGVRPYDVLVLFICLAYIATALDATGGLRYLAFKVSLKARSGYQLYFYLYVFFFFSGAIIGNDPIVLSGTPFLAYLTKVSGISPPTAWIFAQFLAANLSSAILVSSNPTNVLIAGAFHLNFLSDFTKFTVLPSVVAAIVVYPILFFSFKSLKVAQKLHPTTAEGSLIPKEFVKPDVDPREALVDPQGAIYHSLLLLVTLGVLVGTSFTEGVHVWAVTLAGGGLGLVRDFMFDLHNSRKGRLHSKSTANENGNGDFNTADKDASQLDAQKSRSPSASSSKTTEKLSLPLMWRRACYRFPNVTTTLSRLPWPLLPFAVGMFILVQSLEHLGYIGVFAGWTAKVCHSPAAAVFFVGSIVAFGLCPLCGTNIGATILAVQVLNHPRFQNVPHVQNDPRILHGALYAVAIASNTGALTSLPSSLAGLLWLRILSEKGIRTSQRAFSVINLIPGLVITFVALGIVLVEVVYWS
ncbi:hypothetical protein P389DRAFT_74444 [Cystobasidium minutum MCA 4210]|uniref:uncharacterized protein n=1 Tax=Cystobasidium minutum MCA 4210 TaxID=1397322 RepID=UPI0034CFAE6E|eukprot:jgi/Rhomi1/74444/CE74443_512